MPTDPLVLSADDASTPDVITALDRRCAPRFAVGARQSSTTRITFFDTFDMRLHAAGLALRGDASSTLTLTSLSGRVVGTCDAGPAPPGFAWDLPQGAVRTRITPIIEMRRLLPVVDVARSVKTANIVDRETKTIARIRCENGTASDSRTGGTRRRRRSGHHVLPPVVRLTPVKGYERPVGHVLAVLEQDLALSRTPLDEVGLALDAVGRTPAAARGPLPLEPNRPAEEAVRAIHGRLLDTIRLNEDGTRRCVDSEFLHDFRVAVRRVRAMLGQVTGVMPAEEIAPFRDGFKWLARMTGPARDADVYLLELPSFRAALPEKSRHDLEPLERLLHRRQRDAYARLVSALDSHRYRALLRTWSAYLAKPVAPSPAAPHAHRPVLEVASRRIRKAARRVLRDGLAIDDASPADALHDLRLEGKKLRYLIDLFAGLYDPDAIRPLIRSLKKLQDILGRFSDCELQQEWLTECARELATDTPVPVDTLLAMGRLEDRLQIGQAEARDAFAARFVRFARKDNRARIDALFGRVNGTPGDR